MSSRSFKLSIPSEFDVAQDYAAVEAVRRRERARWQRARSIGILGTVLIHFLLLILFRTMGVRPSPTTGAAGPPAGDLRAGGGGGGGLTMIEVRPEQTPAEEPTPEPVPEPEEIVVIPEEVVVEPSPEPGPVAAPSQPGITAPGLGGQDGPAVGLGDGDGPGAGGGGAGDAGAGQDQIIPPTPRGIFIPPPGRPGSARGQEITVWVFVTANGRVDRNQIRLEPPTSDSRYNRRLMQSVAEWVFDPARRAGRPVAVWYPFQIIL